MTENELNQLETINNNYTATNKWNLPFFQNLNLYKKTLEKVLKPEKTLIHF